VPEDKAREIAHKIMKLVNRSKEGELKDEMITYRDGHLLRYNPDKKGWEPLEI